MCLRLRSIKADLSQAHQTLLVSRSSEVACIEKWEFPKIRGTVFGVRIIRILLFRVLYKGSLFSESPKSICLATRSLNTQQCFASEFLF